MKYFLVFVGLLGILTVTQAQDDAAQDSPSASEADIEQATSSGETQPDDVVQPSLDDSDAEEPQPNDNEHPHKHYHRHGHEHPADKPSKRIPVFKIGIGFDTGK